MSAATQRTLYRFLALFLAAGAGDAIVQFFVADAYDVRHLAGVLVAAGIMALEKILSENNSSIAAPTVTGVNVALENQAASVPPPTVAIPPNPPTIAP